MAVDVARYPRLCEVVVHRADCHVFTTVARTAQISPVVTVPEHWSVRRCSLCRPSFGVVTIDRCMVSRGLAMEARFRVGEPRRRVGRGLDVGRGTVERVGWKREANCRSGDERLGGWLSWLFVSESGARWQTDVAKSICGECPVRADCLVSAVWGEEPFGVWGGATVNERRVLLRRWRREGRVDGRLLVRSPRVAVG